MNSDFLVRKLRESDLPDAMALVRAANWNQTENDWRHFLEIEPEGAIALELDGRVVCTTTAICYGRDLAWIGMVLTLPECRGRGFALRLMREALTESRGVAWVS
jgi:GNAT superfamily N-acetyltransferase